MNEGIEELCSKSEIKYKRASFLFKSLAKERDYEIVRTISDAH